MRILLFIFLNIEYMAARFNKHTKEKNTEQLNYISKLKLFIKTGFEKLIRLTIIN